MTYRANRTGFNEALGAHVVLAMLKRQYIYICTAFLLFPCYLSVFNLPTLALKFTKSFSPAPS
jgi:hypothetical protein